MDEEIESAFVHSLRQIVPKLLHSPFKVLSNYECPIRLIDVCGGILTKINKNVNNQSVPGILLDKIPKKIFDLIEYENILDGEEIEFVTGINIVLWDYKMSVKIEENTDLMINSESDDTYSTSETSSEMENTSKDEKSLSFSSDRCSDQENSELEVKEMVDILSETYSQLDSEILPRDETEIDTLSDRYFEVNSEDYSRYDHEIDKCSGFMFDDESSDEERVEYLSLHPNHQEKKRQNLCDESSEQEEILTQPRSPNQINLGKNTSQSDQNVFLADEDFEIEQKDDFYCTESSNNQLFENLPEKKVKSAKTSHEEIIFDSESNNDAFSESGTLYLNTFSVIFNGDVEDLKEKAENYHNKDIIILFMTPEELLK